MNRYSFTSAANDLPWKLLQHEDVIDHGYIRPIHLQLIPTNRCNGNCSFCSCSKEDRKLELPIEEIINILAKFRSMGTKAITITGGGEPTLHHHLDDILLTCNDLGIDIGLVTNGLKWGIEGKHLSIADRTLLWCRMSIIDTIGSYDTKRVSIFCANLPKVDCSVSFTVCDEVNFATAMKICEIAKNTKNLTHVRFVSDILNANNPKVISNMNKVKAACKDITNKAIFQHRDEPTYTKGSRYCRICKVKPLIGADGYVYPCCGVQYATADIQHMPEEFRLCHWDDFNLNLKPFKGSKCKICYYKPYNDALAGLQQKIKHRNHL